MEKAAKNILVIVALIGTFSSNGQSKIETFADLIMLIDQNEKFSFSYPDELKSMKLALSSEINLKDPAQLAMALEIYGIKMEKRGNTLIFKRIKPASLAEKEKQPKQISGYVRDLKSSESLIGAHVIDLKTGKGVTTNVYGFFSLIVTGDSISVGYVGYDTQKFQTSQNTSDLILNLTESEQLLDEVIITSHVEIQKTNRMSTFKLTPEQIKSIPIFMGESDVLKSLQLLPGVQSGGEGTAGLYVRGGGPDQNLILLDGVPVYNASHLFGFFSVFNTDAIHNVEMIKGGFPARYGGRLSSVIDIQMKEGNLNETEAEGAVGLIASKFTVNGPIKKGKSSFMLSGRRTYIDALVVPIAKATNAQQISAYNFWDLNGKINHIYSSKDRIFLSFYAGKDRFYQIHRIDDAPGTLEKENSDLKWGNITTALRWNHKITDRLFSNTTVIYARYIFDLSTVIDYQYTPPSELSSIYRKNQYYSNINDVGLKWDFNYYLNNNHQIRFGANYVHHIINPGVSEYSSLVKSDTTFGAKKIMLDEFFGYLEDDMRLTPTTQLNIGVHYSGATTETKTYTSLQPRLTLNQKLSSQWSVKASYARMAQYIHLLVNSGVGLPTDLWVPSTDKVKAQLSDQVALGLATAQKGLEISIEAYYKKMDNLVEYKDGSGFLDITSDWEDKLEFGKGESYGLEFLIQKQQGRSTGWVGYTWSKSSRTFENLNFGKQFPYRYDRRHDLSLVYNLKINKRIDFGAVWVYGTGNAVTLPTSTFPKASWDSSGPNYETSVKNYPGRNSTRMNDYHRLDLSVSFTKQKARGERKWVYGLYNAYSRQNPAYISLDDANPTKRQFKQVSLFPVIPNVSYQFKF